MSGWARPILAVLFIFLVVPGLWAPGLWAPGLWVPGLWVPDLWAPDLGAPGLGAQEPAAEAERRLVLGTAPAAGLSYPVGGVLCRLVNAKRQRHGRRCLVEATAGPEENLRRLRSGDLDFALVQSDWQYHAYRGGLAAGRGVGGEGAFDELRAVLSLHARPFTLLVAPDSGIERLEDLEGKRLSLGPEDSPWRAAGEFLIGSLGWEEDDFAELAGLEIEAQADDLCAGRVDALLLPLGHPSALVAGAAAACAARLVAIDGAAVDGLLSEWTFYASAVIPGGLYPHNPAPVRSFGTRTTLVTHASVREADVYEVVKAILSRLDIVRSRHAALAGLRAPEMATAANTAPPHRGALRYFRERGWAATD